MKKKKEKPRPIPPKPKWKKSHLIFCKKCKHDHVAQTGPCTEWGCGCNYLTDQDIIKRHKKKHGGKK